MRAWGPLEWLLRKLPYTDRPTYVLGALSAEERCIAVPSIAATHSVAKVLLLKIADPPSRHSRKIEDKMQMNYRILRTTLGGLLNSPLERTLLENGESIADALRYIAADSPPFSLWLDITCMPKRFFFILVKLALADPMIRDLIVTYTQPEPGRYAEEHLAEDPGDIQPLPGFGLVKNDPEKLIIAVGFEALGLPQLLGEYRDKRRFVLVPFPPGQPYSRRIWQTVMSIGYPGDSNIKRVPALDIYESLKVMDEDARKEILMERPPALAPYGPKPISLAMCLYAIRVGSPVFYTQPRVYHPDYTSGIGSSWGYSLKRNGVEVWT